MGFDKRMSPPVKEGEEYNLQVEGFGEKGDPFGKVERFVIFIKPEEGQKLELNETCKCRVTKVTKTIAFAEPVAE